MRVVLRAELGENTGPDAPHMRHVVTEAARQVGAYHEVELGVGQALLERHRVVHILEAAAGVEPYRARGYVAAASRRASREFAGITVVDDDRAAGAARVGAAAEGTTVRADDLSARKRVARSRRIEFELVIPARARARNRDPPPRADVDR